MSAFQAAAAIRDFMDRHGLRPRDDDTVCPGERRQLWLNGQHGVGVAVGKQLAVGGQISQHALGVGAAVDGEKDVHGVWSP